MGLKGVGGTHESSAVFARSAFARRSNPEKTRAKKLGCFVAFRPFAQATGVRRSKRSTGAFCSLREARLTLAMTALFPSFPRHARP